MSWLDVCLIQSLVTFYVIILLVFHLQLTTSHVALGPIRKTVGPCASERLCGVIAQPSQFNPLSVDHCLKVRLDLNSRRWLRSFLYCMSWCVRYYCFTSRVHVHWYIVWCVWRDTGVLGMFRWNGIELTECWVNMGHSISALANNCAYIESFQCVLLRASNVCLTCTTTAHVCVNMLIDREVATMCHHIMNNAYISSILVWRETTIFISLHTKDLSMQMHTVDHNFVRHQTQREHDRSFQQMTQVDAMMLKDELIL